MTHHTTARTRSWTQQVFSACAFAVFAAVGLLPEPGHAEQPGIARCYRAQAHLRVIASSLELFRLDMGRYPTQEEGLKALMEPTADLTATGHYQAGGYAKIPTDPWGTAYQYRVPGLANPGTYDLWSQAADKVAGGDSLAADIGNWSGDEDHCSTLLARQNLPTAIAVGLFCGTGTLLAASPLFLLGYFLRRRRGQPLRAAVVASFREAIGLLVLVAILWALFVPRLL